MKLALGAVCFAITLGIAIGCSKSTPPNAGAPDTAAPVVASARPATSASSSSATAQTETELAALTKRWNDALAKRDADALREVYGARVRLYTSSTDRDGAIKMKRVALAAAPDYTQSIGKVNFILRDPKLPRAEFEKTWTQGGQTSSVRGSLTFAQEGGRWGIVEESDAKTEKTAANDGCLHWVHRVVASTDDGKEFVPPKYSTHFVCGPPECETFQIAAKQLTGEFYFQTLTTFEVDPKTGVVTHGGPVEANPAVVAKMKEACAKEAKADGR